MIDRYSRQVLFTGIGEKGQEKLSNGSVVIIGCGALGSVIATALVRAGVGKVRIVDRDFLEYHNLQRQILFDEDDIRNQLPKAVAAERHLKRVNSSVEIEGVVADVNFTNIEKLTGGADVILDGLDNLETRFLINDVSLKHKIPWVYGGAITSSGMTMTIIPDETPCFRCLSSNIPGPEASSTCDTAGVLASAPLVVGSLEAAEALKILVGAKEINRDLLIIDVWKGSFQRLKITRRDDCPSCQDSFEFLAGKYRVKTTSLCGHNAVQIVNTRVGEVAFDELAARLKASAEVSHNEFMLRFVVDNHEMVVFPDGRAILKNSTDESLARGLYAKYIGT